MVQKTNLPERRRRSAGAGLALALVVFHFDLTGLICPALAASSSSSSPVTRISRPGAGSGQGSGDEIKLMPLQPVVDPISSPAKPAPVSPPVPPTPPSAAPAFPPFAPPINRSGANSPTPTSNTVGANPVQDAYPTIGKLEGLTLGAPQPNVPITDRLARLEQTVFKRVYSDDSLFDRTDRLKKTLLGPDVLDPNSAAARDRDDYMNGLGREDLSPLGAGAGPGALGEIESSPAVHYLDELAAKPENREAASPAALTQFALDAINMERRNAGNGPLVTDAVAESVAGVHVQELAKRAVLSHFSSGGDNPDRRYTLAGGTDAMVESIASLKCAEVGNTRCSKAAMAKTIRTLLGRQDDRDALLSPDATHLGVAMALSSDGDKLLTTFTVITRHGVIEALPAEVAVGDKLEVKGTMEGPYVFDRINIAWEAYNGGSPSAADESEDALPYFPPLDYVTYANRSEHDYSKAIFALKAAGVVAAIAGGMFVPPVALAAPLIMMSGGVGGEVKPVSDIPIKGGVKVEGSNFNAKIPMSNSNKEGLYYITIYGSLGSHAQQSVAVSRRVVLAKIMPKSEHASKPATKYDEEVSAKADLDNSPGTTGGVDEKYSSKSDKNDKTNKNNKTDKNSNPEIFTPDGQIDQGQNTDGKPDAQSEAKPDHESNSKS